MTLETCEMLAIVMVRYNVKSDAFLERAHCCFRKPPVMAVGVALTVHRIAVIFIELMN